jgi:hypothetical protein
VLEALPKVPTGIQCTASQHRAGPLKVGGKVSGWSQQPAIRGPGQSKESVRQSGRQSAQQTLLPNKQKHPTSAGPKTGPYHGVY